jgi:diaminopimelate decarboxylase
MNPENQSDSLPSLTPRVAPWMKKAAGKTPLLNALFNQYGSPINLLHTGPFAQNVQAYRKVFTKHQLAHRVFFARKANKCRAFVIKARQLGCGVDTASYRELNQCLEAECDPEKLVLSAGMKNERVVRLALSNDVLIILDNRDECRLVNKMAGKLNKQARVGVRLSGFRVGDRKLYSRFGFDIQGATEFISCCLGEDKRFPHLLFEGFHFHLDGYSTGQRAKATLQVLDQVEALQQRGITTSFIDIGGGLLTNYLSDKTEWTTFWSELKKALQGQRSPITFQNDGLGYAVVNGKLTGTPQVYPYYNETPKEQFLDQVLSYTDTKNQSVASLLRKYDIEVRIEPGRSLLDQTGLTLATVGYRKQDQRGHWLVGLQMNRSQLYSSSADFLVDPLYIPMMDKNTGDPTAVYFTGSYCLEQDIILKRRIMLPQIPAIGDIIAFPNTAGYMMHFYETQSHLFDFSTNLVAKPQSSREFVRDKDW